MKNINIDEQGEQLRLARAGDQQAFERLVEPYRREILVHCYRILGSFEDAEDMLQETLLRVWNHLDSFEARSSLRTWLYKIATNASLDALDSRRVRGLPRELYERGDPKNSLPQPMQPATWVEPFPDEMIDGQPNIYPEALYEVRESITLAFVAALQKLPGRQRAALLLHDVMGWSANETAEILDMTSVAVNSALQRARETMKQPSERRSTSSRLNEELSALLKRYVAAWEAANSAALVAVLREDVRVDHASAPGLVWRSRRCKSIPGWIPLPKHEPLQSPPGGGARQRFARLCCLSNGFDWNVPRGSLAHPDRRKWRDQRDQ